MNTPNVDLPLLAQNSLQLSPAYNESMQKLDALVQLVPLSRTATAPPVTTSADVGKSWIVPATGATGDWAGHANAIALCSSPGLWVFFEPRTGWYAHVRDENLLYRFNETLWEEAGAGSGAGIPDAPADGKLYGRKDGIWVEVVGGGGGSDAAADVTYDNTDSELEATDVQAALDELAARPGGGGIPDAPSDGYGYVRRNGAWVRAPVADPVVAVSVVSGTATADLAAGTAKNFTLTLAANTTLAVSNPGPANRVTEFEMLITNSGAFTLTLPNTFRPLGGSDTAVATGTARTLLSAKSFDQGTSWVYAMQEVG